ncbi:unnamed protein product [Heterosigma akashiwo]
MAKATRQPHNKKPRFDVATRPLQRLHCDVAGKFPADSKSRKWMLVVCDEYTRFRRCFFMRHKNEVLPHMKSFISMIQRVTANISLLVENIRLDNGTEFSELAAFCDRSGILLEQTGKDNPASNSIAERSNRIVLDMTRVVLRASGLSNSYWSEAAKYSVHTINRIITLGSSHDTTPYQSLFKKKVSIDHFRVFGSICYAHRPSETRPGKLQERAVKCRFLSYNALEETYTLLNLTTHRLWVTKDVIFDERSVVNSSALDDTAGPTASGSRPQRGDAIRRKSSRSASRSRQASKALSRLRRSRRPHRSITGAITKAMVAGINFVGGITRVSGHQVCLLGTHSEQNPWNLAHAQRSPDWMRWREAVAEEVDSLLCHNVWELVDKPSGANIVG